MSIDYSINYYAKGFFPMTDQTAGPVVNAWAESLGGWDRLRELGLGPYQGMANGRYYGFSIESVDLGEGFNVVKPGGTVLIFVYDLGDVNSLQSFQAMESINANLNAGNDSQPQTAFDSIMNMLKELGKNAAFWAVAGLGVYWWITARGKRE